MVDCTPAVPERPDLEEPEDCCLNGAVKFYGTSSIVTFDGSDLKRTYLGSNAVLPGANSGLMTPHGAYGISDFSSDGFGQAARANVYRTKTFGDSEYSIIGQISLPAVADREWTGISMKIYAPGSDLIVLTLGRELAGGTDETFMTSLSAAAPIGTPQIGTFLNNDDNFASPAIDGSGIIVARNRTPSLGVNGTRWRGTAPYISSWEAESWGGGWDAITPYSSSNGKIIRFLSDTVFVTCAQNSFSIQESDDKEYASSWSVLGSNGDIPFGLSDSGIIGYAGSTLLLRAVRLLDGFCNTITTLFISNNNGEGLTQNAAITGGDVPNTAFFNNGVWAGNNGKWTENPSGAWKSVVNGMTGISFSTQPKPW